MRMESSTESKAFPSNSDISLKPENVLIDRDGYAKLTDFGLSKENIFVGGTQANSFCGTCEYLAPEVIAKERAYGQTCDWWSFGCVLYEMLTAMPPFYSKKRDELFNQIKSKQPQFYSYHSAPAVDLISKLLAKDPSKRLSTSEAIKGHEFFAEIDWRALALKQLKSPYRPHLESTDDTKHFDSEILQLPIDSPPLSSGSHALELDKGDDFDGFSFEATNMEPEDETPPLLGSRLSPPVDDYY